MQAVVALVGQTLHEQDGTSRALGWADLMFVAPHSRQVQLLKERLEEQAKVGTVDKFPGTASGSRFHLSVYE